MLSSALASQNKTKRRIEVSQAPGPAKAPYQDEPHEAEPASPPEGRADPSSAKPAYHALYSLPVEIVVCVGTARPSLSDLLNMGRDALIVLDHRIDDPVEVRVGDRVIARGELQEMDDGSGQLGVRLTEIIGHDSDS